MINENILDIKHEIKTIVSICILKMCSFQNLSLQMNKFILDFRDRFNNLIGLLFFFKHF
jgi:hypothetical protein